MYISDHNPVTLTLSLGPRTRTQKIWHYNTSLFPDHVQAQEFKKVIKEYFHLNASPVLNPITIWEALKCAIRGDLMAKTAKVKRHYQQTLETLTDQIVRLGVALKQSLATADFQLLTEARNQLLIY